MLRGLQRRVERWLRRSDPARQRAVRLHRRRVYILPTRAGLIFAIVLLAMFIGATNYTNSLAFMLTFMLASIGAVGMWHTQRNLLDLKVSAGGVEPVFAGQEARFKIKVESPVGREKSAIGIGTRGGTPVYTDLGAGASTTLEISVPALYRGTLSLGRLTASSQFPLGLFNAWSWIDLDMQALVYPHPVGTSETPTGASESPFDQGSQSIGHNDFDHLRTYSRGDSPRHVAWKASARGGDLLTKRFMDGARRTQLLDWQDTPGSDPELKLSQLARWILAADESGCSYALSLPGTFVPPDTGSLHRSRCLRHLALWSADG